MLFSSFIMSSCRASISASVWRAWCVSVKIYSHIVQSTLERVTYSRTRHVTNPLREYGRISRFEHLFQLVVGCCFARWPVKRNITRKFFCNYMYNYCTYWSLVDAGFGLCNALCSLSAFYCTRSSRWPLFGTTLHVAFFEFDILRSFALPIQAAQCLAPLPLIWF